MHRSASLFLLSLVACGAPAGRIPGPAHPVAEPALRAEPPLVILAAGYLDVRTGEVVRPARIVVVDGAIATLGDGPAPEGARTLELGDVTLLPGLVDAHTHLLHLSDATDPSESAGMLVEVAELDDAHRALRGALHAGEMLRAGFTTVRDLGNAGDGGDYALRDAIARGWVPGPRMLVSGRAISGERGQFGTIAPIAEALVDHEYAVVSGPDEARAAVRRAIARGADGIKIIVGSETAIVLSEAEITAIVDEAHRAGRWVAAHATDDAAMAIAARAGVDSIEHGYEVSDETLDQMASRGIALVPTDYPFQMYADMIAAAAAGVPAERVAAAQARMRGFVDGQRERLARAIRHGVTIVAGSDAYYGWGSRSRGEIAASIFGAYAEAGMTPLEIVRSATLNAARLLRLEGHIGEIVVGADADLIAVRGDVLNDVTALQRVTTVVRTGEVIVDGAAPTP